MAGRKTVGSDWTSTSTEVIGKWTLNVWELRVSSYLEESKPAIAALLPRLLLDDVIFHYGDDCIRRRLQQPNFLEVDFKIKRASGRE
ncbi:hypothetical protein ACTXT7_014734 [Hymenolepis weldensis]